MLSQEDYLAPPHIPTGQPPKDVLNVIWRKNDVFLDIGEYSIGSFVMMIWPMFLIMYFFVGSLRENASAEEAVAYWFIIFCFGIFPVLMLLYILSRPVPLPTRFNRQRREVCVPQKDGSYWIVPWEQVEAQSVATHSLGQHGKITQGLLVIGFKNPAPDAMEAEKHYSISFSCGGGTTAMCLWECMRSYMESGPATVPDTRLGKPPYEETQVGSIVTSLRKGDIKDVLHGLFFVIFLGTYFAEKLQNLKLAPPPDLSDPAIVEWSKSLPPERWAKRSQGLETAIAEREQDLARLEEKSTSDTA